MQRFRLCPGRRSDAGVAPTLMVLLTAATLLAACGGAPNPPSTSSSAASTGAARTITLWDASPSPASQSTMPALLARFHAAHPDLTVEYKAIAPATAGAEFAAAVAHQAGPDVLLADAATTPSLAAQGLLEPLDRTQLVTPGQSDDYLAPALASTKLAGRQWALPQQAAAAGWMCNSDLLRKAGTTVAATWTDVAKQAPTLQALGVTPMAITSVGTEALPFVYSAGGAMLDLTNRTVTINDRPAVAGFMTAVDLENSGAATKVGTSDEAVHAFIAGQVACILAGPSVMPTVLAAPAFANPSALSIAPVPDGTDQGSSSFGGANIAVSAASHQTDAALQLVGYLNSTASQTQLAATWAGFPARNSSLREARSAVPSAQQTFVASFVTVLDNATGPPIMAQLPTLYAQLDLQWPKMLGGEQSVSQGADAVAAAWLKVLPADFTDNG